MENLHSDIESVRVLVALLAEKGIRQVVLSPGSRNAPLSVTMAREPGLQHFVISDERSAAFFALGLAQQSGRAVALACTSGTALLNYAPAVAEAYYQGVPLIILSADRPSEWIDQDDGQTIRQQGALANFTKYSGQLPEQISTETDRWFVNRLVNEAVNRATEGHKGPVHLNIPLREPLYQFHHAAPQTPHLIRQASTFTQLTPEEAVRLQTTCSHSAKIMLVAGFQAPDPVLQKQLASLSTLPQVVVLTESLANLQLPEGIPTLDRVLSTLPAEQEAIFSPDLLITFGGAVISRQLKAFLRRNPPHQHWHIDQRPQCPDTYQSLTLHINIAPRNFFQQLGLPKAVRSEYHEWWQAQKCLARQRHEAFIRELPWCDLKAFSLLLPAIPPAMHVQLGNSTPVRYAQLFEHQTFATTRGNRGTSGIDGCTSTAIGACIGAQLPTLLVTGDISFLYDSNALWIKYRSPLLRIIVMQNGGGSIFRFLPGPSALDEVEELFETPYSLDIEQLARLHGFQTFTASNEEELLHLLPLFFQPHERPALLLIQTTGRANGEILKTYFKYLQQ